MAEASSRRTFGLADALILLAATAAGFGAIRQIFSMGVSGWLPREVTPLAVLGIVGGLAAMASLPAMAWSWALLGLRVWSPRTYRRELVRRAGSVAIGAACAVSLVSVFALFGGDALAGNPEGSHHMAVFAVGLIPVLVAKAISLGWLALLILDGHPTIEADWIDTAGCVLGVFWILTGPLALLWFSEILRS